jgi:hypothetical protein
MPTFDTPEPISVTVEFAAGETRLMAGDRDTTTVQVRPRNTQSERDVRAAELTQVELADGRLLVKGPRPRAFGLFGRDGTIEVTIELPAGSQLRADAGAGAVHGVGRLGDCRVRTGLGNIHLGDTGTLDVSSGSGTVSVERTVGSARISTGNGRVRLGAVEGAAVVKSANGSTWVGTVTGPLKMTTANGDMFVQHAESSVSASTANGDIRVEDLARGAASLTTGYGEVRFGVRAGTAARLDVVTGFGQVRNDLATTDRPGPTDERLEVRARTGCGDIVVHRAAGTSDAPSHSGTPSHSDAAGSPDAAGAADTDPAQPE